jgi:hypothetical protein
VESPSGAGVAGATVILSSRAGGLPKIVLADAQGRFFFANLPAASFNIQVEQAGYIVAVPAGFGRVVELADGERVVDLKARLLKLGILSGTVRDDVDDPVVGIDMRAFRRALSNGRRTLSPAARTKTDDRGTYRFAGLQPGDYVVCACGVDPVPFDGVLLSTLASEPLQMMGVAARALTVGADVASLDKTLRTFAPAFHPASTTVARATTIKLGPGEEKTGIDVEVTSVRATRVSGTIIGASGSVNASEIRLTPAGESTEGAAIVSLPPMLVQPDNRFDFAGVPPGQYILSIFYTPRQGGPVGPTGAALQFIGGRSGPAPPAVASAGPAPTAGPPLWAAEPVTVGDDGVSGLAISLRRAPVMSGRVEFVGSAPQPPQRGTVILSGIDQASFPNNPLAPVGNVKPDNTFELANLVPGRYVARVSRAAGYPTVKSVMVNGADVIDLPFSVESTDINGVVFTLVDTPMATLSGSLVGGRSPSAPDLSVIVFPVDRKYWVEPFAASQRFRSTPISRGGSYALAALPAGEYLVAVVPDDATVDWIDPAKLDGLSRTAQHVQLADGDKKVLDVKR